MKYRAEGIIVAMATPFTKGGDRVDFDAMQTLAEHLVGEGAHGLFVCGTTGEGMLMTMIERKAALEAVIEAVGDRSSVVAHTGALDTMTAIELSEHAAESGAAAAGLVAPGYYGYDDKAIREYYRAVARAIPELPVLLYNIPGCAINVISVDLAMDLAASEPNIVGIKDSSGDMGRLNQLIGRAPKGFQVINGSDEYGFQAFMAGAPAAVSGTGNVVLPIYRAVYDAVINKQWDKARKAQFQLTRCCEALAYGRNIAVFKEGLRLRGLEGGAVRPPQRELSAAEARQLAEALKAAGALKGARR